MSAFHAPEAINQPNTSAFNSEQTASHFRDRGLAVARRSSCRVA